RRPPASPGAHARAFPGGPSRVPARTRCFRRAAGTPPVRRGAPTAPPPATHRATRGSPRATSRRTRSSALVAPRHAGPTLPGDRGTPPDRETPAPPLLAGLAAAAVALPVAFLPVVTVGTAVAFGVGVAGGVASGRRARSSGT